MAANTGQVTAITKRPTEPIRTIDEIAELVSDGIDVNDISRILFILITNVEKLRLSGATKKQIVMFGLNKLRERVPDDKKDEFDWIVAHGPQLIDEVISLVNHDIFKKFKPQVFKKSWPKRFISRFVFSR